MQRGEPVTAWADAYAALIRRLQHHAARARMTLCGLSTCLDVTLSLHEAPALLAAPAGSPAAALAAQYRARATAGIGGEIMVAWPEGPAWLAAHAPGRPALGGSGAQAAYVLSLLGAPTLMSLGDRSAPQLAVIHPETGVADGDTLRRSAEIVPSGEPRPPHVIVEYTAGRALGEIVVPRSTRTITRFAHDDLDDDPAFERLSTAVAGRAGAGILSGFNGVPPGHEDAALARAARIARGWRAAGLATVHLELGDYTTEARRQAALAALAPCATSLGMSLSELAGVLPGREPPEAKAVMLGERWGLDRVCIHADAWALAATRGDPVREHEALLAGCLLAASRAEAGRPAVPRRIPAGATFHPPPLPPVTRRGPWSIVCVPAPHLETPAATIGLGDTFLAGCLLVLGLG